MNNKILISMLLAVGLTTVYTLRAAERTQRGLYLAFRNNSLGQSLRFHQLPLGCFGYWIRFLNLIPGTLFWDICDRTEKMLVGNGIKVCSSRSNIISCPLILRRALSKYEPINPFAPFYPKKSFRPRKTKKARKFSKIYQTNVIKLSRSLSGVEAILLASTPLSQRFILPRGA